MSHKLLISDANILIDMEIGGLLEAMFQLDCEFAVPDILFEEELRTYHPTLPSLGLIVMEMSTDCVASAMEMVQRHKNSGTSNNDLIALALAIDQQCPLLTGDGKLRQVCREENWEVRGTLWLMERIFEAGIADLPTLEAAYQQMKDNGRRLPWRACERLLERLR